MGKQATAAVILLLCLIAILTGVNTYVLVSDRVRAAHAQRQQQAAQTRARETAVRIRSATRLRAIGQALTLYSMDHADRLPSDDGNWLAPLYAAQYLSPEVFDPPLGDAGPMPYRYVMPPEGRLDRLSSPQTTVLGYEDPKMWNGAGAHVLYADTHVEWLEPPRLQEVLGSIGK